MALVFGALPTALALQIDTHSAAVNDRFANNPAFIAAPFNLSGVSRASNGAWVTMIAPNVFVGANHYTPAEGNTVPFYLTNNSSGPSVIRTVSGARLRIGSTDIFLGTLAAPLPEGYATYPRPAEVVTDSTGWTSTYRNSVLYHVGLSPGVYSGALDVAVGRNVADRWFGQWTISPSTTWAFGAMADTSGAANYQTYETKVVTGDSGAPIFYDAGNNSLRLLGITWGTGTYPDTSVVNIFTYLGNYQTEIASFLATYALPYLPDAPSSLAANRVSAFRVDLTWTDHSSVETAYVLERSTDGSTWSSLATLAANSTAYSDTAAPSGDVHYRLKVVATNAVGTASSDLVSVSLLEPVPPATPSGFAVSSVTTSSVELIWGAVANADSFTLERSTLGIHGPWEAAAIAGNATAYSDTGRASGTSYWYRLRATNAIGSSAWTTVVGTATANSQALVTDSFTDGGVTDGTDPLDADWKKEGTAQIVTTDTLLDPGSPANVMEVSTTTTEGDVYAYFTFPDGNQTLAVGESLKLSFRLRHTGTPRADNSRTGFSLAYTSANNPWPGTGNREYMVRTSYGSNSNLTYMARTADLQLVNSSGTDVFLANNQPAINAGTTATSAWMEVQRTGESTVVIRAQIGSNPVIEAADTGTANGANVGVVTTFNRVFFRFRTTAGTTGPQFRLDDVVVTKTLPGTPAPSQNPVLLWRDEHFSTTANSGVAADNADPDRDGIPNLVEYALGTIPTDAGARPLLESQISNLKLQITLTPATTDGLRYIIEASSDLSDWSDTFDITPLLQPGRPHIHTDSADIATTPRRFLRLRVSTE